MVAHIVDQIGHAGDELIAETEAKSASDADILKQQADAHTETENATQSKAQPKNPPEYSDREVSVQSNKVDTAPQQDVGETPADRDQTSRRSHGGALPS
jgi:hypothetical protein